MSTLNPFDELGAICRGWKKTAKWVFDGYDGYEDRRDRDSDFKAHATRFENSDTMLFIGYVAQAKDQGIMQSEIVNVLASSEAARD